MTDVLSHRLELLVANENIDEGSCSLHRDRGICGRFFDVGAWRSTKQQWIILRETIVMICLEAVEPSAMLGHLLLVQRSTQMVVEAGLVSCSKAKIRISYKFIGVLVWEFGVIYNIIIPLMQIELSLKQKSPGC